MVDANYESKIQEAVAEVDQPQSTPISDETVLSSGVRLRHKKFSRLILQAILDKFPYPEPPKVKIPEKDRYEINPNSPQYKEQIAQIDMQRSMAIIDAGIVFGTEMVYKPDSLPDVDDDGWIDDLDLLGIPVKRDNKKSRFLAWIKYEAMRDTETDLAKIMSAFSNLSGVSEEAVAEALDNFRGVQERSANTGN